jgi:general secretion pathway protein K
MNGPLARPARSDRGAALLLALVAIAILTALAVDLSYETQVRLRIAGNARDELRAGALARSGLNLSRLVLTFQQQLDQMAAGACQVTGALAGGGQAGGAAGAGAPCPRPQLWNLVPVGSLLTDALFPAEEAKERPERRPDEGEPARPTATYGDFEGGFEARIEDEGQKVNAQLEALQTSGRLGPQVESLLRMTCDARWDGLFDREGADGQRYSRTDLLLHLRDWADDDAASSALTVSFPAGNCSFLVPPNPFEQGFGDENFPYDRGRDRYRAKNARLDSLAELHLIAGVTDAFMAAFGDQLTVYLPREAGMNVNTDDPLQQLRFAWLMAEPASQPLVADPGFAERLRKALADARMGGFLTMTPVQFAGVVEALGVKVRSEYLSQNPKNPFTDRSMAFRIRSLGAAGDVTRTIDAVVSFDPNLNRAPDAQPGQPGQPGQAGQAGQAGQPPVGRLIRWREE